MAYLAGRQAGVTGGKGDFGAPLGPALWVGRP